ncbi:MAG TPA: hypothetical protein VN214_03095 [Pseudomonas sp.]|nr:hypothetical protein [Pseudomonas sp.]
MTIPILWVNHMASERRTYEWIGSRIEEVGTKKPAGLGIQNGLLLFTLCSLGLVFSGGALAAILFAAYAIFIR